MTTCPSCGKRVGKTASFCASCGTALRDDVVAPAIAAPAAAPEAAAEGTSGSGLPRWLVTDWPLALVCVVVVLGIAMGVGAVIGLAATLIAHGASPDGLLGVVAGAWLPFSGLGSDVVVTVSNDEALLIWFTSGLAPAATVGLGLLARWAYRTALPRVAPERDFTLAFVAKVAALGAVLVAVLGTAGSIGDPLSDDLDTGFQVMARSSSSEPALWALVLFAVVGLVVARDRLTWPRWFDRLRALRPLRAGLAAWLVAVAVLGLGTSIGGALSADDSKEGIAGAVVAPVILGNTGVAAQAFAVGASVETVGSSEDIQPFDRDVDAHLSLFHFDLPPDDDSDAAPIWLWPVVLVMPLAAFWATRRWLRRGEPADGSGVLAQVAGVVGGFALGAWFGAVVTPFYAGAGVVDLDDLDFVGRAAVGRPAVAATVGLTLLWSAIGALPAAVTYARKRGLDLLASSSSGAAPADAAADAEPVEA